MPSRNVLKPYINDAYYHIYARGASKADIFREPADFHFFLSLFGRYLSLKQQHSPFQAYSHLRGRIELLCYCLMSNHFHLLIYQSDSSSMQELMRGIMTSYSRYFNKKYSRSGSLFESRYKASLITAEEYLLHISRYIHLNPRYWKRYPYSSLQYFQGSAAPEWLQHQRVQSRFSSTEKYMEFLNDYEDHKAMLNKIKKELVG